PYRVQHPVLSIHMIMLNEGMKERVLRRNAHLARINFYVLDIPFINFIAILGQRDASTVIETLQMGPGDGDINAPDHHVAFLLGMVVNPFSVVVWDLPW